jgi:hypothetical protein
VASSFYQRAGLSPLRLSELLAPGRRLETYVLLVALSPRRGLRVVENAASMAGKRP